ncbi:MAG: hypothetical protein OEZ08_00215 [Betaproteobacteria bacterium]|nr:hypothetical protein [Betaproteobacteria bacterium]
MPRRPLPSLALVCAAISGTAVPAEATAAELSPQVWLNPGIYSLHFNRNAGYRDNNIGIGAEVLLTNDHALMAGSFINSDRKRSRYGAYEWRPLHWQVSAVKISAGIAVAAFDGYPRYKNGGWFAAALPLLAVEGERLGVNLALIPNIPNRLSGALAIQIKLRVW